MDKEFECDCIKCKHKWIKRSLEDPKMCPKCKSYDWKLAAAEENKEEVF